MEQDLCVDAAEGLFMWQHTCDLAQVDLFSIGGCFLTHPCCVWLAGPAVGIYQSHGAD